MKIFGLLELSIAMDDARFTIGVRTTNDKSMRLSMLAGYQVFSCDNIAMSEEFKSMLHTYEKLGPPGVIDYCN